MRQYLLENFPVQEGDVYLSGTPAGVGPLRKQDELIARVADVEKRWTII